jgi:hypothetical protein
MEAVVVSEVFVGFPCASRYRRNQTLHASARRKLSPPSWRLQIKRSKNHPSFPDCLVDSLHAWDTIDRAFDIVFRFSAQSFELRVMPSTISRGAKAAFGRQADKSEGRRLLPTDEEIAYAAA